MSGNEFNAAFELYRREIHARTHQNKRLYEMPIDEALLTGEVVGPSSLIEETGEIQAVSCFQFKLRRGDKVKLCVLEDGKLVPLSNTSHTITNVRYVDVGAVRFKINALSLEPKLEYYLALSYDPVLDWTIRKRLQENSGQRRKADINANIDNKIMDGLNSGQENSIETVLSNQFSGVIQGPPGTGKTEVLSRLAEIAVANNLRVGVLSYTNKAVDNALERISKVIDEGVVRVVNEDKAESIDGVEFVEQFSKLKNFKVYGSTVHKFLLSMRRPPVDIIILDEASQIPSYFLAGIKHACSNIIMIGDHHQLPPIMQVDNYRMCPPDCFTYFKNQQDKLPMLDTQFRMNETIQDWSSVNYYDGKLRAYQDNAKRDVFCR
jgi:superfamily I DNA and/or RNA helicase